MSQEMITEITLDHLPDLSDASLSFQIPADNSSADLLLADVTDGFNLLRRGTDDDASFATLLPTPRRGPPLTLGELTPKPESASRPQTRSRTPKPSSSESSDIPHPLTLGHPSSDKRGKTPPCARSKLRDIAFDNPLVSEERQEQLAPADVETLGRHPEITTHFNMDMAVPINEAVVSMHSPAPALRPKMKLKPRTKSKPTVTDGGISKIPAPTNARVSRKAKNLPSSRDVAPAVPHCTASQNYWPQSGDIDAQGQLVPPASMNDDINMPADNHSITPTTSRMAERLVSYSQKLISSIGMEGKNSRSVRARDPPGPSSAFDLPLFKEKPNATLSTAQLTKPVAFTFRVDSRLEARRTERLATSEQGMHRSYPSHVVPDFRALHESHQSTLACRKDNMVPSTSVESFFFYTEQRAKERERFDEMVKRKEEETQRAREEQRRLAALEEARAIKELRKKAIPKANEVPECPSDTITQPFILGLMKARLNAL
ncbi:hypothetical protein PAXRUDRAFT_135729 [Paxillus rubicundulus Ve08.2h10]|uniref:Unplaced genomic scaffold scaffold_101, whole genome shotgun sequence n=1 Tax=Paxillus rubicundulus Ve08.2h10 TaxID=930991 RepID=A0A0D0DU54_9AGAM|nr:hypothetical protein PAXRUDRAFT_135729 [Paxillus rubicundulus Ve08.2h10]